MWNRHLLSLLWCSAMLAAAVPARAQSANVAPTAREHYDLDYIGPPLADPVVQHAKETYVVFGCAYCHGVNLVPRGEAPDLRRSPLVGQDVNGSTIVPLLRTGIPQTAKLSPMPQFSDLSDQQLHEIASWIHYARQQDRYRELMDVSATGDVTAGKAAFDQMCSSCHSTARDLAGVGRKYDAATLRAQILSPKELNAASSYRVDRLRDAKMIEARERHQAMLENYTPEQLINLTTYLQSVK